MLFNTLHFFFFYPLVTALYFLLPYRLRWPLLLFASCYFYMAFAPLYILILLFTILIDYAAGIFIESARAERRRLFLVLSLVANVGVLAFFKYFNFLNANLQALSEFLDWNYPIGPLQILLPIGLSFHTFQSMAYTVEVYRGKKKAERHLGIFALYVMFYPQLVAGPIERPQNLLPQFRERHHFDSARMSAGLRLMLWGLFKKVAIADPLAVYVNQVYEHLPEYSGFSLIVATIFFAFQIYCDFSGYSDIAIGSAETMGFRLMKNFDKPYFATSIGEFWRRWHISLSTFFRDYVYIPLGGSRVSAASKYRNLLITFAISGLWHGANWTFVIWGALHGLYMVAGELTRETQDKLHDALQRWGMPSFVLDARRWLQTFSLVCFAWIFFRATSISDAFYVATHLFADTVGFSTDDGRMILGRPAKFFYLATGAIFLLLLAQLIDRRVSIAAELERRPFGVRFVAYAVVLLLMMNFGIHQRIAFIYFQF